MTMSKPQAQDRVILRESTFDADGRGLHPGLAGWVLGFPHGPEFALVQWDGGGAPALTRAEYLERVEADPQTGASPTTPVSLHDRIPEGHPKAVCPCCGSADALEDTGDRFAERFHCYACGDAHTEEEVQRAACRAFGWETGLRLIDLPEVGS